ncbi:hypothetical protein GZH53_00805 [Flavihumibacter sp. R14]|nr:hypothetical protein [Flavihumibacter soli]
MQTTYLILSILKGLIIISGFVTTIYFIVTNTKEKRKLGKALVAFTITFIALIAITVVEFAIAT